MKKDNLTVNNWEKEQASVDSRYMSWIFRIVALAPIAYTISAFILGYYVVLKVGFINGPLTYAILLSLIISSTSVLITVTVVVTHYWTTMKITQQHGRKRNGGNEEQKKSILST